MDKFHQALKWIIQQQKTLTWSAREVAQASLSKSRSAWVDCSWVANEQSNNSEGNYISDGNWNGANDPCSNDDSTGMSYHESLQNAQMI